MWQVPEERALGMSWPQGRLALQDGGGRRRGARAGGTHGASQARGEGQNSTGVL